MRLYRFMPAALALLFAAGSLHATPDYPVKPIRFIVAYPPGGGADIAARMLAPKLSESFKQSMVVDNRAGGGGTVGAEMAARAIPDGYTLFLATASYATNPALYRLPYDPVSHVTPIALFGESGSLLAVHPSVAVSGIKELIAHDKANPGKLNYGSAGAGSTIHLFTELFNQMAGTKMTHVPYKGTGPVLNDLLGGQIHLAIGGMSTLIPWVKSGRLRGIAVTTARRSSAVPDLPTVGETIPDYEAVLWYAVLGPKALPADVVARWSREIDVIVQMPDIKARMAAVGIDPVRGSPQRFRDVLKRDVEKWRKVVMAANIRVDG